MEVQKGGLRNVMYFLADKMPQVFFECMEILYNIMAIKKLKLKISKIKPQLIYERYSFFCFAGIYISRKAKIPIVLEVNEVGGFDRVRPQKLVKLSKIFESYIFSHADFIITVSEFLKKQIVQRGGEKESILTVPNGININLFNKQVSPDTLKNKFGVSDSIIIGFVGYLVHWHRLDMLMEVYARIRSKFPKTKLFFVGDGILRNNLETLAKSLGIESDFIITGRVDHSEIPDYINIFDVAVIPNSNEYRSPIKMFEYMAMGKAIVAPDQPPIVGVLRDGIEGAVFENGNSNSMYSKLELLLANKELCSNIGKKAQELVFSKYTWDIHAKTILDFVLKNKLLKSTKNER
jgi:glycosyltransferase involved in cell wall biosynthesis